MRLALGHLEGFDETVATFARQLGLSSVQFHTPSDLRGAPGYWEVDELVSLRERCEAAGLVVEGLENVPFRHWDRVLFGEDGREEQLESYRSTIRNMATAGIHVLGHHFMPTYVWRTDLRGRGRGDALVTVYDGDRAGEGNALAGYKLAPDRPVPALDAERMWANYAAFLDAVLPAAEAAGVRLALHPDDPPVDSLGGVARIFATPDGLERAWELARRSPAWGLDLCLGTVSEMGGEAAVNRVIDSFGPRGGIAYVHFRDVQGTVPRFRECFLGEGNYDPAS
ncbi:MAG TPA: mannonate dehydratase, partial [Candidatus Limnocylindrales bacterium]